MRGIRFLLLAIVLFIAQPALAQFSQCGDYDGDGSTNIGDMVAAIQYLFEGGAPPDDFDRADFDLCEQFTFRDQVFLINCVIICDFWNVQCPPTNGPYTPSQNLSAQLIYPDAVPRHKSKYEIDLHLSSPNGIQAFCFPLRLRIDSNIPVIDSIRIPAVPPLTPAILTRAYIDAAEGNLTLIGLRFGNNSQEDPIARIFVSTVAVNYEQAITMEWITTTPTQAPAGQENTVFAYASDWSTLEEFYPVLTPDCCILAGDVNHDGSVTVSDVITYICFVFGGCMDPEFCLAAEDIDHSGAITISDAVFLINYIFAGGPFPTCR